MRLWCERSPNAYFQLLSALLLLALMLFCAILTVIKHRFIGVDYGICKKKMEENFLYKQLNIHRTMSNYKQLME